LRLIAYGLYRTSYEWVNPAHHGLVFITTSDGRSLPYGKLEDVLSRDSAPHNCHTSDSVNAWVTIDFGECFVSGGRSGSG